MRYIIYGAGGIGGSIGARLFLSGADVMLIARGAHYEAIARDGLHFVSPDIDQTLNIPVVSHPSDILFREDDVVLMCMKSQHTHDALLDLVQSAGDRIPVVACQNGVANESMAMRHFSRVYGMLVFMPGLHLEPGLVANHAKKPAGCLDAGCFPQGIDETITQICAGLQQAGFASIPNANIMGFKYYKLLLNLMNVVDAAIGQRDKTIVQLLNDEALACFQAAGIDVANQSEISERLGVLRMGKIKGYEPRGNSSYQSLLRGTGDIEVDYLNGEISWLGRLHGIPTPANEAAQRLGRKLIQEGLGPGSFSLDQVMAMIGQ